ncbi:MAG: hypothetical protein AAF741_06290 [Bacteroidota bacterium]
MDKKTPRILLIEPLDHIEIVARWSRYFSEEQGAEVSVALNTYHLPWAQKNLPNFECHGLAEIPRLLPEVDLTILVTIGNDPSRWWPLLAGHNYWVVGHNLSLWLGGPLYDYQPKNLARYLRDRWRRSKLLKLLEGAKHLLVPTDSMRYYLCKRKPGWPVITFPFAFPREDINGKDNKASENLIRLFIPGRVDDRFRDYNPIVEALQPLPTHRPMIELVLAGQVATPRIVDQFSALGPSVQLIYQPKGLDDRTFHEYLTRCDFVIAPLRPSVRSGAYREYIGYTKISGSIFDAVAADKVLLLPAWHPMEWRKQKGYRNGTDLLEVISKSNTE